MPFKQKAKKNKEGSSSSALARRDLASRYKAPFPIYTMEEGERFTRLAKCNFTGMVLDTIYNASRHQGKVTLGVGSMAPILAYVARMPIPAYQPQPTDIFRYMDGAFLKKTGLVEEVKTGTTILYHLKPWERRVRHSDRDEGTSDTQMQRQRKGKAPVTSSSHVEEEEEEVTGWKQVLGKVEALQQSQETVQVTVFDVGQKLHTIQKNRERMERKWMKYFPNQNIEFPLSPPGSPEA
ncbi:hypothetical protein JCGZ_11969 [Jatropha curcas]|uniref:Uncharacterized protein n=1 Tax=Jatropha curcas TaxID=180498 RepID=A0A067KEN8_JATCU|nr:hypothetical protein JCGZ_11969 [Jatropha curcas]